MNIECIHGADLSGKTEFLELNFYENEYYNREEEMEI